MPQKWALKIDNDIMVANPDSKSSAWVIALVAAGGLAAALSTICWITACYFKHQFQMIL